MMIWFIYQKMTRKMLILIPTLDLAESLDCSYKRMWFLRQEAKLTGLEEKGEELSKVYIELIYTSKQPQFSQQYHMSLWRENN